VHLTLGILRHLTAFSAQPAFSTSDGYAVRSPSAGNASRWATSRKTYSTHIIRSDMKMTEKQKIRNFLIGFIGWFIAGNLIIWLFFLLPIGKWVIVIRIYGFGIATIIIAFFLFYKKRNWYAFGIVSALTINAIAWKIYLIEKPVFLFAHVLAVPLPVGLYNLLKMAFPGNA
jgi:hypothetical protein